MRVAGPARTALTAPKTLTVANCVVSIQSISAGKAWRPAHAKKERTHALEIHDAQYLPRVSWVRPSTQLTFRHAKGEAEFSVHGYFNSLAETVLNFILVPSHRDPIAHRDAVVRRVGTYLFRSDLTAGSMAYVFSSPHPYVAGPTKTDGKYAITDLPPGTYKVRYWHEGIGVEAIKRSNTIVAYKRDDPIVVTREVVVAPGKTVTLDWTIPVREDLRVAPKEPEPAKAPDAPKNEPAKK